MMRVAVVGAGAMGCLFGGLLWHSGAEVVLVDVSKAQIEALNREGLRLERDGETVCLRVPAAYAHEVSVPPDLVVVFTKTVHTASAMESATHMLGEATLVLSLQNGLGNDLVIERFHPRSRIVQGITTFPADLVAPGCVRSLGPGVTRIMWADGVRRDGLEEVRAALDRAGLNCAISEEVQVAIWEKVAFNVALNSLAAVLRVPVGPLGDSEEARSLARRMVEEVVSVAQRKGIGARLEQVLATVESALAAHRSHKPSMLQDVLAGRATEIDALNGAVAREAASLGMSVPVTETLDLLVKAAEGARASGGSEVRSDK
jgi:2-dehydropantoate 2-reductase